MGRRGGGRKAYHDPSRLLCPFLHPGLLCPSPCLGVLRLARERGVQQIDGRGKASCSQEGEARAAAHLPCPHPYHCEGGGGARRGVRREEGVPCQRVGRHKASAGMAFPQPPVGTSLRSRRSHSAGELGQSGATRHRLDRPLPWPKRPMQIGTQGWCPPAREGHHDWHEGDCAKVAHTGH